jgi:DNA polymerase IV
VGKITQSHLERDGFRLIGDLQQADERVLMRRYGAEGLRLSRLARGIDDRPVNPERETKSVSAETTFNRDLASYRALERQLWDLSERVSARLKAKEIAGSTVTLKLKSADFRLRTRARALDTPTQLASRIFAAGRDLLARETDGTSFRLIGVGVSTLGDATDADQQELVDQNITRIAAAERAMDRLRSRFGQSAVVKGLAFGEEET